jgi:anti-sigma factor RsiW
MDKIPRLTAEQRANLVAFIDRELPPEEAGVIEAVLKRSPTVQYDVEMLSRTWDLLDELPRVNLTQEFTVRTLAAIKADEAPRRLLPENWSSRLPWRALRRGAVVLAWAGGLALSAVAGFAIANRVGPDTSQELLENLPVIEKLDLYSNVESIEFLRQLDKRIGSFDEGPSR